jgi:uncharacterized damage-inducible protein DinB
MSSREAVIACLRDLREQLSAAVEAMPADRWTANVYEGGWNERQLLYHIASTSGVASFVLAMSKLPKQTGGEPFDNDAFNRDQVALREGRSPAEALDEIRSNIQRDIQAIEKASDDDLQRAWTAPWGMEGAVADIIIASLNGHLGTHLDELRDAAK